MSEMSYEEVQREKYELWAEPADAELEKASPTARLVAEGDSWFDYPIGLDILDSLKKHHEYKIYKVADAGDTVENMVYGTETRGNYLPRMSQLYETLEAIRKHTPRAVLFSAGGNDIAGYELEGYLNHRDSGLPPLREDYAAFMLNTYFKKAYERFFRQVWSVNPDLHIIGHGYGRPIPDGRAVKILGIRFSGPWLRPAFAKKRLNLPEEARKTMSTLMNKFNEMLADLQQQHPKFHYIDLRDEIRDEDWENELHLNDDGYKRCANLFHEVIQSLP